MVTMVEMEMVEMVDNEGEDGGRDGKYEENADCMMASVINTHRAVEVGAIHNTDAIQICKYKKQIHIRRTYKAAHIVVDWDVFL